MGLSQIKCNKMFERYHMFMYNVKQCAVVKTPFCLKITITHNNLKWFKKNNIKEQLCHVLSLKLLFETTIDKNVPSSNHSQPFKIYWQAAKTNQYDKNKLSPSQTRLVFW